MNTLTFKMQEFEGPLDLLLALVSKNKMQIYDINIHTLIEQYIDIVNSAQAADMDVASEFIEMAARLVQMKSYLLLPKSEESERLQQELTGLLVEYSLCKIVANHLKLMSANINVFVREPSLLDLDNTYNFFHTAPELLNAYSLMHTRAINNAPPRQERFEPLVEAPFVSISSKVIFVLRSLSLGRISKLKQLFSKDASKSANVATFLALLELVRAKRIFVEESGMLKLSKNSEKKLSTKRADNGS